MKTLAVLLVAACFAACTYAFPGARESVQDSESDESKDVDTILVLPETRDQLLPEAPEFPVLGFEDSSESSGWNWNSNNLLSRWYSRVQAQMRKLREQVANILSHVPEEGGLNWSKIPEGANTTSTTKIIDGHVVTINETTYTEGDDEFGTMFRIRVIDVKPQNETYLNNEGTGDAEVTTLPPSVTTRRSIVTTRNDDSSTPTRSVETLEESDNEIPRNQVETLNA